VDEILGVPLEPDEQVRSLALRAINTQHLQLSLKQWVKVQAMVEAGVKLGMENAGRGPA
jgi:predicted transcriptional regulator